MKHLTRILILLTLAALLAGCADSTTDTADAGDRPRPTTAATTQAEPETDPPAVAEIAWAKDSEDPWAVWSDPNTPALGKLHYRLDPKLAEGQTTDPNTRYVMSFTYVTADFHRYDLTDYLVSRGLQAHVFAKGEATSYITLFDLTEEEIQSITPESVQAYYSLDSAPAVVGVHRKSSLTPHSETAWYRADLLWGEWYVYDILTARSGAITLADPLTENNFKNPNRPLAIWCEVRTDSDKACKDYFAGLGWEIMDEDYCMDGTNHTPQMANDHVLVIATFSQLLEVDIAEVAVYYDCDVSEISVVFTHAMPRSIPSFEEMQ